MNRDMEVIDELIDSGKLEEVYNLFGCKVPKHKVDELKCKECKQLKIVKTPYSYMAPKYNWDCPPVEVGEHLVRSEKISFACRIEGYVSDRKELKKSLEKVSYPRYIKT